MDAARSYGTQAWNRSLAFLSSDGLIPQLVITVIIVLVLHFVIMAVESLVSGIKRYGRLSATLLPYTYISKGGNSANSDAQTVIQDPKSSKYPFMYPSENEVTGLEFSYSFHLYIDPDTYSTAGAANDFYTIFYKGGEKPWPILGPGVFLNASTNTIRIYMNSVTSIADSFVEIPNVPVGKWAHLVITQRGQNMDVYINGNIAVRKTFKTIPLINYGNVYVFPNTTTSGMNNPTTGDDAFKVVGAMKGMISRLKYYSYAINYTQIDSLLGEGISKKIVSTSMDQTPPYFHDSWWVTRYNAASDKYGL